MPVVTGQAGLAGGGAPPHDVSSADPVVHRTNQIWVEVREKWDNTHEWTWEPELIPVSAEMLVASQGAGRCLLEREYGPKIKPWWAGSFEGRDKWNSLRDWWVRIQAVIDDDEITLFCGQIDAPVEDIAGDQTEDSDGTEQPSGRQQWVAHGPLHVLEKATFSRSPWLASNDSHYLLDWVPNFNWRHGDTALVGNRSETPADETSWLYPCYTFGGTETWTAAHIMPMALQVWVMDRETWHPKWYMAGFWDYLQNIEPQLQMSGIGSVAALATRLISTSYGIDFIPVYYDNTDNTPQDEGFELWVFGLYPDTLEFEGYTSLANPCWGEVNVSNDRLYSVEVERGAAGKYDKIRIAGDRILSVFTLGPGGTDAGVLYGGWTEAEEAVYLAGDTSDDAKAAEHDSYRASDRFRFVFQRFYTPVGTFTYGSGTANQVFAADGSHSGSMLYFQRFEVGTQPSLPLAAGYDYTTNPPTDRNPTNAQRDYLPIMVFAYDPRAARYICLNTASQSDPNYPPVEVRALEHELGVLLRCSPQHFLAYADWSGAAASRFDPVANGVDWRTIRATICVETDNRISVEYELPDDVKAGNGAVLEIIVPSAQFWWLSPYTVVGVDNTGALLTAPAAGAEIRNDVNYLRSLMPGMMARYLFERTRATVTRHGQIEPWDIYPGAMLYLTGEQGSLVNTYTPITGVKWDFRAVRTTMYAGHSQKG